MPEQPVPEERLFVAVSRDDDPALRPCSLADFHGQPRARTILEIELSGSRMRDGEVLDHILLHGPPGLGKTSLANIVANEVGGNFVPIMGPSIERPAELASALACLHHGDVLFIDEIHRIPVKVAELLYGALEDFKLNLGVGDAFNPRPVCIPLPRFTFIGATTRPGMLPRPLRDRFGVDIMLELYSDIDLADLVERSAALTGAEIGAGVAFEIARRSRGTPRVANKFLKRVRNFAAHSGYSDISLATTCAAFQFLGVDSDGLEERDRRYVDCLVSRFNGRHVGLSTICAFLGEDRDTVELEIEPWLLKKGLVDRTSRGRTAGDAVLKDNRADAG